MRDEDLKNALRAVLPRGARNWLRSPSKSGEWLWDHARFFFGVTQSLELAPNWQILCHPHAYKVFHRSQITDCEQSLEFQSFVSRCSEAMLLYDIGAHFGIFSLAAVHFGGKAVAVDPSPIATRMITIEAALNRCLDSIRILCAAASDTNGTMRMLNSGVFSDGYFKRGNGRPVSELTQAQAITIDGLVYRYGIPTHIKIDVEGHEAAVLRGARLTLRNYSPLLFIELHNEMVSAEGGDPSSSLEVLSRFGYQTYALSGEAIERSEILSHSIIRIVAVRAGTKKDAQRPAC